MALKMEPFSMAHMLALENIKSPFLCGDSPPFYDDLIRAALICAQPINRLNAMNGWWFRVKVKLWLRRCSPWSWEPEIDKLQRHILAGLRGILASLQDETIIEVGNEWRTRE